MNKTQMLFPLNGDSLSRKMTYQGIIPFTTLKDKVLFTHMMEPSWDPYAFETDNPHILSNTYKNNQYQRRTDPKRINKIKSYIRKSILKEINNTEASVLFPTSLLLAITYDGDIPENGILDLNTVLTEDNQFYIVDGQHRLQAMNELYNEFTKNRQLNLFDDSEDTRIIRYLENYKFNCTILLNYDLWEQARVFADVNFNQKKVDRSLYYTIYGMWYSDNPDDWRNNHIFIAHSLVEFLNNNESSPLKGMIRILGNGSYGLISQAFLADSLIRNIKSPRGCWYLDSRQTNSSGNYRFMAKEIITFLTVIKNIFIALWPKDGKHQSILLKTTGIGALIRLMGYIHQNYLNDNIKSDLRSQDSEYMVQSYYDFLMDKLSLIKNRGEELFGYEGDYARSGGKGLESKLYKKLVDIINNEEDKPVIAKSIFINGQECRVIYYRNSDGLYSFILSSYYKNPDQMATYIPGSGAIADNEHALDFKLRLYSDQVHPDAIASENKNFDHQIWEALFNKSH